MTSATSVSSLHISSTATDSIDLAQAKASAEAAMNHMEVVSRVIFVAGFGASVLAQVGGVVGGAVIKNCIGVISDVWDSVVVSLLV